MFPRNEVVGQVWVASVNNPILSKMSYQDILKKGYWICYRHFSVDAIHYIGRKSLARDAIPTLFLQAEDISTSVEAATIEIEMCSPWHRYTELPNAETMRNNPTTPEVPISTRGKELQLDNPVVLEKIKCSTVGEGPQEMSFITPLEKTCSLRSKCAGTSRTSTEAIRARRRRRRAVTTSNLEELNVTPKASRVITETLSLQKQLWRCKKQLKTYVTKCFAIIISSHITF